MSRATSTLTGMVVAALAVVAGLQLPAQRAQATVGPVKVLQWNVAGGEWHFGQSGGIETDIENAARTRDADVISLIEVCHDQFTRIRDNLRADGTISGWLFEPQAADPSKYDKCGSTLPSAEIGDAILTKAPASPAAYDANGDPQYFWYLSNFIRTDGGRSLLVCAKTTLPAPTANGTRPATVCTTHFDPAAATLMTSSLDDYAGGWVPSICQRDIGWETMGHCEASVIRRAIENSLPTKPVLVVGDMNRSPNTDAFVGDDDVVAYDTSHGISRGFFGFSAKHTGTAPAPSVPLADAPIPWTRASTVDEPTAAGQGCTYFASVGRYPEFQLDASGNYVSALKIDHLVYQTDYYSGVSATALSSQWCSADPASVASDHRLIEFDLTPSQ